MVAVEKPYIPTVPSCSNPVREMNICLFTALSLTILLSLVLEPQAACPDLPATSPFFPSPLLPFHRHCYFGDHDFRSSQGHTLAQDPSGSYTLAAEITWGWWGWGQEGGVTKG